MLIKFNCYPLDQWNEMYSVIADTAQVCNLAKWLFQIRSVRSSTFYRARISSHKMLYNKYCRLKGKKRLGTVYKGLKIITDHDEHLHEDDSTDAALLHFLGCCRCFAYNQERIQRMI